jgi:hypothetical protein
MLIHLKHVLFNFFTINLQQSIMTLFFTFTSNHDKKHRNVQNKVNRFVSVNNGKAMNLRLKNLDSLMVNLKIFLEGDFPFLSMYHLEHVKSECCVQVRFLVPAETYQYETIISISDVCKWIGPS